MDVSNDWTVPLLTLVRHCKNNSQHNKLYKNTFLKLDYHEIVAGSLWRLRNIISCVKYVDFKEMNFLIEQQYESAHLLCWS